MLVSIDKSAMTAEQREYPFRENLMQLVEEVGRANPLLNFICDPNCVTRDWNSKLPLPDGGTGGYEHMTYKVKVFQDGEELGALLVSSRYRRSVGSELVYGVESFRIRKERGRDDTAFSKDLKVALRTAKKTLVCRADEELVNHIYNQVKSDLFQLQNALRNAVRYSLDVSTEAMVYAEAAYVAHLQGKATVELPVKLVSIRNYEEYLKRCGDQKSCETLCNKFDNGDGYAIKVLEDGKLICIDTLDKRIIKYKDFDSLPNDIANKFAMFKVLSINEVYEHLGVKLTELFYFIVK